ncbi:putative ankyrin repeat-containing domain protein [Rosellinia necatrix]|uniref:Putative ankyrin repeat-containing domain protein n=1 Tax=Rosellinia necatrix TaxID=77044 RepID=A0A1W2TRQ7_ROSNE|nr:putative ankyrin repeat-containing domain protein [Rosellinia necatrix]
MSSIRREPSEASWDDWKGTIRRLYLQQKRSRQYVLRYLKEHGFDHHVTQAQLDFNLEKWKFRQKLTKEGWNFVRHTISKRERLGKRSAVVLSGVKLRPDVVRKETLRNRPLPRLGLTQPSPSPEPPADLPLVVCSPAPMHVTVDYPPSLPWVKFQTQFNEHELRTLTCTTSGFGGIRSLLPVRDIDITRIKLLEYQFRGVTLSQECLPHVAERMALFIPESWEGESLKRADILLSGSGPEKLRQVLMLFIAILSNNHRGVKNGSIGAQVMAEADWGLLRYLFQTFIGSKSNHNLLQSQIVKAFLDTLFSMAYEASVEDIRTPMRGADPEAKISHQIMAWLLHAGYNLNRYRPYLIPSRSTGKASVATIIQHAVTFGDNFQSIINILIQFGADIYASNENEIPSALQLVLDESLMKYWSGSSPQVALLQSAFIEKAMGNPDKKNFQILGEHAIRHGKKDLLETLCKDGFNMEFCQRVDFGWSSEVTPTTCAAQFCPESQEQWEEWLNFLLDLMPSSKRNFSSNGPLVCAAAVGNNAAICYFFASGCDLSAQNELGISPLIAAVSQGRIDTCRLLLSLGVDGNAVGPHGLSALYVAVMSGYCDTIRLLVPGTKDKNEMICTQKVRDILERLFIRRQAPRGRCTVLDLTLAPIIRSSSFSGQYEEAFEYLARNKFCLSWNWFLSWLSHHSFTWDEGFVDMMVETHLKECLSKNNKSEIIRLEINITKFAIYRGYSRIIEKYFKNNYMLQGGEMCFALTHGNFKAAALLLRLGVDIKTRRPEDPSFLEAIILSQNENIINWALAFDPGYYDAGALCAAVYLFTPLPRHLQKTKSPNTQTIRRICREILMRRPKNLTADMLESTAVGIAAEYDVELLRYLLSIIPPSPYCLILYKTSDGSHDDHYPFWKYHRVRPRAPVFDFNGSYDDCYMGSPLVYAVDAGREECFSLMLERGYQPDEATLFQAISRGTLERVKFVYRSIVDGLIAQTVSYHRTQKRKAPPTVSTLIEVAAEYNRTDVIRWLLEQDSAIGRWTGNNLCCMSPLQNAVRHANVELVNMLLNHGVSPNEKPNRRDSCHWMTALQLAAVHGYIAIANALIGNQPPANVNAHRWPHGQTALEAASGGGHLDMVQFLLCHGAKTEGTGRRQYLRAILFAQRGRHVEIVNMLKAHRRWTQHDEELLRNESVRPDHYTAVVDESECSDSECEFPHGEGDSDEEGDSDDEDGSFIWNPITEDGDSDERDFLRAWDPRTEEEDSDEEGVGSREEDSRMLPGDQELPEGNMKNGLSGGTSKSPYLGKMMSLEEVIPFEEVIPLEELDAAADYPEENMMTGCSEGTSRSLYWGEVMPFEEVDAAVDYAKG